MKKGFKGVLASALGIACLGGGVLVVGLLMGGTMQSVRFDWHNHRLTVVPSLPGISSITAPSAPAAPTAPTAPNAPTAPSAPAAPNAVGRVNTSVRKLDIETGACDVYIQEGDDFSISGDTANIIEEFNGDEWKISMPEHHFPALQGNWGTVTITVPRDMYFEEVEIDHGAGDITIDNITCSEADFSIGASTMTVNNLSCAYLDLELGAGKAIINGSVSQNADIEVGMGNAVLTFARPATYGYDVECGMGSVTVDGNSYSGFAQNVAINSNATPFFDIDCGMGSVNLMFE